MTDGSIDRLIRCRMVDLCWKDGWWWPA